MTTASPYCPGCFRSKPPGVEMCGVCSYDESVERKFSWLPHWARLQGGKYVVGRVLGEGGFGITYLALDRTLRRLVAIKELFPQSQVGRGRDGMSVRAGSADDADGFRYALSRFLDEARTVASFNHPQLVRVLDFFEENGTGYLVMEYYKGGSLSELFRRQYATRPMPEVEALGIMRPVLAGLAVVHDRGWMHRDIKPPNIYLADWKQPVLLDFGAARMAVGEKSRSLSLILTDGYAPIEQYSSRGRNQGPWTDIYACAATLYHVLSGRRPPSAIALRMGEEELRPLSELRRDIRPAVSEAIERGMALAIEDRPRNVAEFLRLLDGAGVSTRSSASLFQRAMPTEGRPVPDASNPKGMRLCARAAAMTKAKNGTAFFSRTASRCAAVVTWWAGCWARTVSASPTWPGTTGGGRRWLSGSSCRPMSPSAGKTA